MSRQLSRGLFTDRACFGCTDCLLLRGWVCVLLLQVLQEMLDMLRENEANHHRWGDDIL